MLCLNFYLLDVDAAGMGVGGDVGVDPGGGGGGVGAHLGKHVVGDGEHDLDGGAG